MWPNNGKENIYDFCDIFRGKARFDENCSAAVKVQDISKTTSKTQEDWWS